MTGRWTRRRVEESLAQFDSDEARVLRLIWKVAEAERGRSLPKRATPIGEVAREALAQLGVTDLHAVLELRERWKELAGPKWSSRAVPIVVREGELLVEAGDRRVVRQLEHDRARLVERLAAHFDPLFITRVRVVAPPWRRGT